MWICRDWKFICRSFIAIRFYRSAIVLLPVVQIDFCCLLPTAGSIGERLMPFFMAMGIYFEPVDDVCVRRFDAMSVFVQILSVTTNYDWSKGEVLVVRHRRWDEAGKIKSFAFGFPFAFEFFPGVFATPIFLGITHQDEHHQTRQPPKKPAEVSPATEPANENHQTKQRCCADDAENDHGKTV